MKATLRPSRHTSRHPVDEVLPAGKLAVYGAQHVLAFYAGAVIVPILLARDEFVETFGGLFQGPRWAVERAWDMRPFADTHALRRSFQEALFSGSHEEQRQLIEAYPQLGSQFVADGLSGEASLRDQEALGLTFLADPDRDELGTITKAYRERFGFPLVISVRDADSFGRIVEQGRERLGNCENQEDAAALLEIAKIAGYRFDDFLSDANPIHSARTRWSSNR